MKNKSEGRGLKNSNKVFQINSKEDPVVPPKLSSYLTSRTVDNSEEKIKTFTPVPDPPTAPINISSSKPETLPATKTEIPKEKRHVYAFDRNQWQSSCGLHKQLLSWHNGIADEYKKLGFGAITEEIFNSILGGDISAIEKRFFDDIEKNIEKMGLSNEAIKDNMRQGTEAPFIAFKKSVTINLENITRSRSHWDNNLHFDVNNYCLRDGRFYFDEQEKEKLKVRFETYLDSGIKKEFASKVAEVEKLLVEIREICRRNGIKNVFGFRKVWELNPHTGELFYNKNILNHIIK